MSVTYNLFIGIGGWASGTYAAGDTRSNAGNGYRCVSPGTSTAAPTGTGTAINNGGTAVWTYLAPVDYSDLPTATAALPATYTQPIIWQFWNCGVITTAAGTRFLSLSGHTTTSANFLTLTAAYGDSIRDSLRNGITPLAFDATKGVSFLLPGTVGNTNYFDISDPYTVINGLQFQDPLSTSNSSIVVTQAAATNCTISNCVFDGYPQNSGVAMAILNGAGSRSINNLYVSRSADPVAGSSLLFGGGGVSVNDTGISIPFSSGGAFVVTNTPSAITVRNAVTSNFNIPVNNAGTGTTTADHCSFDQVSGNITGFKVTDGGSNLYSQNPSTQFVSTTTDFRTVSGSSLINAGATDTTDIPTADDIAGNRRPLSKPWDIGCWQRPTPFAVRRSPIRLRL